MAHKKDVINSLFFSKSQYPEVIAAANKLAKEEKRKPHDVIARLIIEAGAKAGGK